MNVDDAVVVRAAGDRHAAVGERRHRRATQDLRNRGETMPAVVHRGGGAPERGASGRVDGEDAAVR